MAMKGMAFKEAVMNKILETFEGSFVNDKEIRVCGEEDGQELQVKVTLTLSKVNVPRPAAIVPITPVATEKRAFPAPKKKETEAVTNDAVPTQLTKEEKSTLADLLTSLGL